MDSINEFTGMGGGPEERTPPIGPGRERLKWKPGAGGQPPAAGNPRFAVPGPAEKPELSYLKQSDLDVLLDRINAEEEQPPHKKNAARIAALKQQAMELMKRLESQWVQRNADELLPRLDENQAGA